ncbi:hypothetical protein R1sor_012686 [Riccia sorocarpa]|uniref:Uncharacterized protein n=1 Tax=Riccia sorocarpa TaxID=122646 RepID=A0ABD3I4H3_9MARC
MIEALDRNSKDSQNLQGKEPLVTDFTSIQSAQLLWQAAEPRVSRLRAFQTPSPSNPPQMKSFEALTLKINAPQHDTAVCEGLEKLAAEIPSSQLNEIELEELGRIKGYLEAEGGRTEEVEVLYEHYDSFKQSIQEAKDECQPGRVSRLLRRLNTNVVQLERQKTNFKKEVQTLRLQLQAKPTDTQKTEVHEEVDSGTLAVSQAEERLRSEIQYLKEQLGKERKTSGEHWNKINTMNMLLKRKDEEIRSFSVEVAQAQELARSRESELHQLKQSYQEQEAELAKANELIQQLGKAEEERKKNLTAVCEGLEKLAAEIPSSQLNEIELEELGRIKGYLEAEGGRTEEVEVLYEHYDSFKQSIQEAKDECQVTLGDLRRGVDELRAKLFPEG